MDQNTAAERFMMELDQSDKKRYHEREFELDLLAEKPGSLVNALGHNYRQESDNWASGHGGAGAREGETAPGLRLGRNVAGDGTACASLQRSSHETSKFEDVYHDQGRATQADARSHWQADAGEEVEVSNHEATISRYLIERDRDSQSRAENGTGGRGQLGDLDSLQGLDNRNSTELAADGHYGSILKKNDNDSMNIQNQRRGRSSSPFKDQMQQSA